MRPVNTGSVAGCALGTDSQAGRISGSRPRNPARSTAKSSTSLIRGSTTSKTGPLRESSSLSLLPSARALFFRRFAWAMSVGLLAANAAAARRGHDNPQAPSIAALSPARHALRRLQPVGLSHHADQIAQVRDHPLFCRQHDVKRILTTPREMTSQGGDLAVRLALASRLAEALSTLKAFCSLAQGRPTPSGYPGKPPPLSTKTLKGFYSVATTCATSAG